MKLKGHVRGIIQRADTHTPQQTHTYTRIHVHLISEHASILEARRRRSMNIETFPFLRGSVTRSFESDHTTTMLFIRVCLFFFLSIRSLFFLLVCNVIIVDTRDPSA